MTYSLDLDLQEALSCHTYQLLHNYVTKGLLTPGEQHYLRGATTDLVHSIQAGLGMPLPSDTRISWSADEPDIAALVVSAFIPLDRASDIRKHVCVIAKTIDELGSGKHVSDAQAREAASFFRDFNKKIL